MWFIRAWTLENIISDTYARSSPNSSLLTYPPYLSYSLHFSNPFCFSFFLPAVHITNTHSSWDHFLRIYIQPFALPRLPVISHRSFILFHASGTLVQWYLLTINKTRGHYTLSLPSIFILHSFLSTYRTPRPSYPLEILSAANFAIYLHTFLLIFSIKVSSWSDFYTLLRFLPEIIPMFNLLLFLTNFILTKHLSYSLLHLSGIVPLFIHIPWSCRLEPLFFIFLTRAISSLSYCPTRLLSKPVCTPALSVTVCTAFSVFFQFAWNRFLSWPWSALPSVSFFRSLFFSVAHGLLRRVVAQNARPF